MSIIRKDRYERYLTIIYTNTGTLNEELVKQGYAWVYPKSNILSQKLKQALKHAQRNKKNIWIDNTALAPWVHRKNKRLQKIKAIPKNDRVIQPVPK